MSDEKLEDLDYKNRTEENDITDKLQMNGFPFRIKLEVDDNSGAIEEEIEQIDQMMEDSDYKNQPEETDSIDEERNFKIKVEADVISRAIEQEMDQIDEIMQDFYNKNQSEETDFIDEKSGLDDISRAIKQDIKSEETVAVEESLEITKEDLHCHICNLVFDDIRQFKKHRNGFNQRMLIKCEKCDTIVFSRHELVEHKETHNGIFSCNFCEIDFSSIKEIIIHNLTNHPEKSIITHNDLYDTGEIYIQKWDRKTAKCKKKAKENMKHICIFCNNSFTNWRSYKKHRDQYNRFRKLNCCQCGDKFITRHALVNHTLAHTKNLNCTICKIEFEDRTKILSHGVNHGKAEGPFPCGDCKRTFLYIKNLAFHRITHLGIDDKAALLAKKKAISSPKEETKICEICNIVFEKIVGYRLHMQIYNEKALCYCRQCGEVFLTEHDYVKHESSHIGDFTCTICKMDFTLENDYLSHKNEHHHSSDLNLSCSKCDKTFTNVEIFIKHAFDEHLDESAKREIPLTHTDILKDNSRLLKKNRKGIVTYLCNLCRKTYKEEQFDTHKEKHLGKVWYLCGKCDQTYEDWKSCRDHQITEHHVE